VRHLRAQHLTTPAHIQEAWGYQRAKMKGIRWLLWKSGAFRIYADGDIFRPLFRWWHPVTWLVWIAVSPVALVVPMFTSFTVISIYSELGCRPVQYFRDNPDELFFVK